MSLSNHQRAQDPLGGVPMRLTYRTMRALAVIAAQPGLTNRQISELTGIADDGQISRLLTRLSRLGLIENTGRGSNTGQGSNKSVSNAWNLTPEGRRLRRRVGSSLSIGSAEAY